MDNVKWITKKDESGENKHIPIRPRKPFGVSREKALREVEKLREMGLRARLIETNRKHKLYAPYEAIIDEEGNPIPENETNIQKDETKETKEIEIKKEETKEENKEMDTQKKYFHLENKYSAEVFHPRAFEDGVYTVRIHRDGIPQTDENTYSTMVDAKSPIDAYEMVINTPKFKRWKEDVEKRIKEGKERTD